MRWLPLLCFLPTLGPGLGAADSHWLKFTSGPFEVLTDAGPRAGRETMVRFIEFRQAVGDVVGETELVTPMPVRILLFKSARGWTPSSTLAEGRATYNIVLEEKAAVPAGVYSELARLFLDANTAQMPPVFEHGLVEFFSTFDVAGIKINVGAPPPTPDLDWARVHLLVTSPDYYGKLRVLLYNLRHGVADEPAYRNAFGKSPAEIEAQAHQHLSSGGFQTTSLNSRPVAPTDFPERPFSDADARLARADVLAGAQSAAEYRTLLNDNQHVAEAKEGLGLLSLREGRRDEARGFFADAIQAGSSSAHCYIEYARLETDQAKASQALLKAAALNPKLDEPFVLLAQRDQDPQQRLAHWKAATQRNPRNLAAWQALAEGYLAEHDYKDAAGAWTQAEQAATDPATRARMRQNRTAIEQQRLDYEAAEKQRQADEDAREVEMLKAQAKAHLHQLEAEYNGGTPTTTPGAVPWWNGPQPDKKVRGTLKQVECLGKQLRLGIEDANGKILRLLVPDPSKIVVSGGATGLLACGPRKQSVVIEYFTKANARMKTAGEVATIEFQ
ncbi:MAG TPA: hypothetical protein VMB03_31165 [Bryobacteraceae bacterium]|nr:hypothetical protein [Bryobacteraceae bacterium]